jgi:hypothetical protein
VVVWVVVVVVVVMRVAAARRHRSRRFVCVAGTSRGSCGWGVV